MRDEGLTGARIEIPAELRPIPADERHGCQFCSSVHHEAVTKERGIIEAEYKMVDTYGNVLGYTCGMCVEADAKQVPQDGDRA